MDDRPSHEATADQQVLDGSAAAGCGIGALTFGRGSSRVACATLIRITSAATTEARVIRPAMRMSVSIAGGSPGRIGAASRRTPESNGGKPHRYNL